MLDEPWEMRGLCGGSDVNFFAEEDEDEGISAEEVELEISMAKSICHGCPVRELCLQAALDEERRFGVWGGADETTIRKALNIDQYGKPVGKEKPMVCPLCSSINVATLKTKRTTQHLQCESCSLSWWSRVPTQIVKINAETEDDDLADNIPTGSEV